MRTSYIMKLWLFVPYFCVLKRICAETILWSEDTPQKEEHASQFKALLIHLFIVSSQGWLEGCLFDSYYTKV